MPAVLDVGPSRRQVADPLDVVEDDGRVADGRPDHAVAFRLQGVYQGLKPIEIEHGRSARVHPILPDFGLLPVLQARARRDAPHHWRP